MNSINITHELCAEDRARIDRLTAALEAFNVPTINVSAEIVEQDPIQKKLAETLANIGDPAEAPKNATEPTEAPTAPTAQPQEEKPTEEEEAQAEPAKPTVTLEQIQKKVILLAAGNNGAKKAKVREIVNAHAQRVSDLPEEKWPEVWAQLTALEKEV